MSPVAAPAIVTRTADGRSNPRPWRLRPLPDDFREQVATGMTIGDLMAHYDAGTGVVHRWIEEIGGRKRAKRAPQQKAVPDDFVEHAQRETVVQLIQRYRCGTKTIARWRRQSGVNVVISKREPRVEPLPDGFDLVAPTMTMRELKERFGRGKTTIWKWCQRANVQPRKASTHPPRTSRPTGHIPVGRKVNPFDGPHRDVTRAGMAADFLRKFGPVVRCDAAGRFNPTGDHWRRGASILCADEIISRALRNGWQPDAWREVRAA